MTTLLLLLSSLAWAENPLYQIDQATATIRCGQLHVVGPDICTNGPYQIYADTEVVITSLLPICMPDEDGPCPDKPHIVVHGKRMERARKCREWGYDITPREFRDYLKATDDVCRGKDCHL